MYCTILNELPPPPHGKTGWPWTLDSSRHFNVKQGETKYPSICIVTPSFNQANFLEETIRSVLLQGYPNLEYIIMDGGSTDDSVQIIKKYSSWLAYWVSEKDKGQADAIYRGFEKSTSEIIGWVNSDDLLLPGSLIRFRKYFSKHPGTELLVGGGVTIDERSIVKLPKWGLIDFYYLNTQVNFSRILLMGGFNFLQPASLWKRGAFFEVGGFDRSLIFCFDLDLYLRLTKRKPGQGIREPVAAFRLHAESKTKRLQEIRMSELDILLQRHGQSKYPRWIRSCFRIGYRIGDIIRHKIALLKYITCHKNIEALSFLKMPAQHDRHL